MPASSALTSSQMCGFFLFWFVTCLALFLSIPKWKLLIHLKLVAYILSSVGMLAMALKASGGVGDTLTAKATVHGTARVWLIVRFTLLAAAGCSTFASNASDWQRNATKRRDPIFGQVFGFPMSNVSTAAPAHGGDRGARHGLRAGVMHWARHSLRAGVMHCRPVSGRELLAPD
jgi:NCS1 family nucleobase:cation symporter-1